ncbi:MAG TPA: glycerol-3-phosphate dehydrogenase/oxidase [Terriglobales bacterium]|nr:glycerol-3-phosphate dehydrogenase/oxidase [Terriglobales bacterium]
MKCAVVGGGINGVMAAWALARRGHRVDLYERGQLMAATSSASTKLIHGGLRYLEHGEFRLVREALRERTFWISSAPDLVHPLQLFVPLYEESRRPRWLIGWGLILYDLLAGKANLGKHRWFDREGVRRMCPQLRSEGLRGAFAFFDAQMDDLALGMWAAQRAEQAGVEIHTETSVDTVGVDGSLHVNGRVAAYDAVVNAGGPWAETILDQSGIPRTHGLDLVRGSHLILARSTQHAFLVEVPGEERFCFVLPYQGQTLLGTTEVRQTLDDPIACSVAEQSYLLGVYNHYIRPSATDIDVVRRFAGLRPLLRSNANQSRATREYAIEVQGRVVSVFGGKWTTSRALGEKVASTVEAMLRV